MVLEGNDLDLKKIEEDENQTAEQENDLAKPDGSENASSEEKNSSEDVQQNHEESTHHVMPQNGDASSQMDAASAEKLSQALDKASSASEPSEVQEAWHEVLQIDPEHTEAIAGYTQAVFLQYEALKENRPRTDSQSVSLLNKAIEAVPNAFTLYDLLAAQFEMMNRRTDWIGSFQKKANALRERIFDAEGNFLTQRKSFEEDRQTLLTLYLHIASIFIQKFQNQAEATKAYESVLEVDPENTEAIEFLKTMYEKRRDWEKLIAVSRREITLEQDPDEKASKIFALAKMASEKLRKPPINIELWQAVLEVDPNNETALSQLETLYEREKNWENLAEVCARQVEILTDDAKRAKLYQKLGLLWGDKLKNPQKAVDAWRGLLQIDPTNRRAQDSLKKKYLELQDWEALEEFYAQDGKWEEFIRLLERTVDSVEPEVKISILFTVARLYADKVNHIPKARRAYERIFEFDPQNRGSAQALIPIYEEAKDWKNLVSVKEINLSHTQDHDDRIFLLLEIAQLQEENLNDQTAAFDTYRRVLEEEWTRDDIRQNYERLAKEVDDFSTLVSSYEATFSKFASERDAIPVMLEVGRAYCENLEQIEKSIEVYHQVLAIDAENEAALLALEYLFEQTERWEKLLVIRQKKANLVEEGQERNALRVKIAQLLEEKLDRPDDAVVVYGEILTISPEDLEVLRSLDGLYQRQERYQELVGIIERELAQLPSPEVAADLAILDGEDEPNPLSERVSLMYRRAQILEHHLRNPSGAIASYRDILSLPNQVGHEGARLALEGLIELPEHRLEVSALLSPVYEAIEMWDNLIAVKEIQLGEADETSHQIYLLHAIALLSAERKTDYSAAFVAYARAFRIDPSHDLTREALENLAEGLEIFDNLVFLYQEKAEAAWIQDPDLARAITLKIAEIQEQRLQDINEAVLSYRRLLEAFPADDITINALEGLYQRTEQWQELLGIYQKKIELAPDIESRKELYFQMANLLEVTLEDPERTIGVYQEILDIDSANQDALNALYRLFGTLDRWGEAAASLERQLEFAETSEERIATLLALAEVRETRMQETAMAVETFKAVTDIEPEQPEALAALERLIENPEHRLWISRILEPLYANRGDYERLVWILEIQLTFAETPLERVDFLHRIGRLHEEQGQDVHKAFEAYGRALQEDPENEATHQNLERLASDLGDFQSLVDLYVLEVANVQNAQLAVEMHTKIAGFYEEQLENQEGAIEHYKKVLEFDPDDLNAIRALKRLYQMTERYRDFVEIMLREADVLLEIDAQKEILFHAANILEEVLEDPEGAIDVYHRVLNADPEEVRALDALVPLFIRNERWEDLARTYERKAELIVDIDEKKPMLYEMGAVYERELQNLDKAIETYQRVLDLDAIDRTAIEALDRLYQAAERWNDLLNILERERDLAEDIGEIVALKYRISRLLETKLQDEIQAVSVYQDILENDDAHHQETLDALENISRNGTERLNAALVLEPIYQAQGSYEPLVGIYEVELSLISDPLRKLELLTHIAAIQENYLQDLPAAFFAYSRAVRVESSPLETLDELERLAIALQGWQDVVVLYEDVLVQEQDMPDPERHREVARRLARIYRDEINDIPLAITKWQQILGIDPEDREAIDNLDLLYLETQSWDELAKILGQRAQLAVSDEERVENLYRLAQLHEQELKAVEPALESYRNILEMDPDHAPTINALELLFVNGTARPEIGAILEPYYERNAEWSKLVELKKELLVFLKEKDERIQVMQFIAELCETRLEDTIAAFEWFGHAFTEDPSSEFIGGEFDRLARQTESFAEMVTVYENRLQTLEEDPVLAKEIALKAARCYEVDLRDYERAEQAFRRVLALDSQNEEALVSLDRIYLASQMFPELAEILKKRIEIAEYDDDKITLHFRLGKVYQEFLQNLDGAIESFQAILTLDAQHEASLQALEQIYTQREEWDLLFAVLEKEVETTFDGENRARFLSRMADIAAYRLDNQQKGVELWDEVVNTVGEHPQALSALESLHESAGRWEEVVQVLNREVYATEDLNERVLLHAKLGRLYEDRLSQEEESINSWNDVLNIDQNYVPALLALSKLYRRTERFNELADTLRSLIGIGTMIFSENDVLELYAQLGELCATTLMSPQEAIQAWQRVLDIEPANERALEALEKLYRDEAEWEHAIRIIEIKGDLAQETTEKVNFYLQVASLWKEEANQPDNAAQVYNKVVELIPGHPVAFEALEEIYVRNEDWDQLIEMLLTRVEQVSELEAVPLLRRVAQVFEREKRDPENAFVALLSAAEKDYRDNETALELERLSAATNKWNELLTHYTKVLNSVTDDKQTSMALANKIAKWYGEQLGQVDYAIAYYQYVLNIDGGNLEALQALEMIYRRSEKWDEVVTHLEKRATLTEDHEDKKAAYHQLAQDYEQYIQDPLRSIRSLVTVHEFLPDDVDTMRTLERLYQEQELWDQLIDVLDRRAKVTQEPDEIIEIRYQIGNVYRDFLQDNEGAIQSYESILAIDGHHLPSLRDLQGLYRATGNWEKLLQVLDVQMEVVDPYEDRVALLHEKAQVFEEQYQNYQSACECHEEVLQINPAEDHSFHALERLYRAMERWEDLINLYQNHIYAVSDQHTRLGHYNQIGKIYHEHLQDDSSAIDSYNSMLDIDRDSIEALEALSHLYEAAQDWPRTMELLGRLVDLLSDQGKRVECYYRMGRIAEEALQDPDSALERYQFAIDVDPAFLPALASLREIYKERQDWENAISMLKQEEAYTSDPEDKSALLYHIGYIYHAELGDITLAQEFYERAMQWNPNNNEAAQPLSDIYFTREEWGKAEPLLDLLIHAAQEGNISKEHAYLFHYRLAFTSDRIGNTAKADQFYRSAYELAPEYLPILLGRADLLFRGQDWDQAFRLYQTILSTHREEQSEEEIIEVFYRLGTIKREIGEKQKAIQLYKKGLELQPHHRPTLEALIEIYIEENKYKEVINYKHSLVEAALDGEERFNLLVEIGDIWKEFLQNLPKSVQAYHDALEYKPTDRSVLHKVMTLYYESKQWSNAIDIIERIAELEEDPKKRAKFYYSSAVILRDELKEPDKALDYFNKTLTDDYEYLKAFEKIDQILTQKKDWKTLERNYRAMIKRVPPSENKDLQIMLWHGLGEIYRTRQGNLAAAAEAFEIASKLDPANQVRHEILAELYATDPSQWQDAVKHHHKLLEIKFDRIESFQSLYRIYMQSQQYDKAFCIAAALRFLKQASPEEQGFHEQYRQKGLVTAKRIIDDDVWRNKIAYEHENPYVSAIFRLISRSVAQVYAKPEKELGLRKKDRQFDATQLNFPKRFQYVNQILKVAKPVLYLQQSRMGLDYEPVIIDKEFRPAVIAGADLLAGKGDKEVVFLIAKNLAYMRPEYFLIRALKMHQTTIKLILRAAMVMVAPQLPIPPADAPQVKQFVAKFSSVVPAPVMGQVKKVVDQAIKEGNDVSTTIWMQHVEIAANRAGLVLCNDLDVAARMVQTDPTPLSTLTVQDKIKDLIMYGISEEYFQLRESLEMTITG